jgi:hypothetical protein
MNHITGTNSADGFGFIAHRLVNNERNFGICLRIDQQDKKISIVATYKSLSVQDSSIDFTFEWSFGA